MLAINGAEWPFLDGTMTLLPTQMVLGASEVRHYTLVIKGLNAAKFVERMELSNISVAGTFDGSLPLVFDQNGGRIVGGILNSRAPGGSLSYVGALTYKDLSPMGNYAFQALRALDYRQMRVALDGSLEGEVITRVQFDGVTQGTGTKRNFITRQIARLPLKINVNIRAPFAALLLPFNPKYLQDRYLGLRDGARSLDRPGKPALGPPTPLVTSPGAPVPSPPQPPIQPLDSRTKP